MCRRDGLVVKTKCCKCVKLGPIPRCVNSILMSGIVVNSTRDEKELSRIKKKLKQVYRRDGLVVRTKCCKCVKPGSIPGCLKIILGLDKCIH
jgi:hypothetical protein